MGKRIKTLLEQAFKEGKDGGGYRAPRDGTIHVDEGTAAHIDANLAKDATIKKQADEIGQLKEAAAKSDAPQKAIRDNLNNFKTLGVPDMITDLRTPLNTEIPKKVYVEKLDSLRKSLEDNGQLVQKRKWGMSDIPRTKDRRDLLSIEERIIDGKDVTTREFERYKRARIERLEEVQKAHQSNAPVKSDTVMDQGQINQSSVLPAQGGKGAQFLNFAQAIVNKMSFNDIALPQPQNIFRQHWKKTFAAAVIGPIVYDATVNDPGNMNPVSAFEHSAVNWVEGISDGNTPGSLITDTIVNMGINFRPDYVDRVTKNQNAHPGIVDSSKIKPEANRIFSETTQKAQEQEAILSAKERETRAQQDYKDTATFGSGFVGYKPEQSF